MLGGLHYLVCSGSRSFRVEKETLRRTRDFARTEIEAEHAKKGRKHEHIVQQGQRKECATKGPKQHGCHPAEGGSLKVEVPAGTRKGRKTYGARYDPGALVVLCGLAVQPARNGKEVVAVGVLSDDLCRVNFGGGLHRVKSVHLTEGNLTIGD